MFDWELDVYWPAARTNLTLNRFMQTKSSLTTGSLSLETLRSHSTRDDNNRGCHVLVGSNWRGNPMKVVGSNQLREMAYGALNRYLQQV